VTTLVFDVGETLADETEFWGSVADRVGVPRFTFFAVRKPSPEFFARLVQAAGCPAAEVAYVGDRIDNDVDPALEAGLVTAHIRRGPWGHIQSGRERAHAQIDSLDELPGALP
jgi:FMN phosphatase YigB (HAD superfamily)